MPKHDFTLRSYFIHTGLLAGVTHPGQRAIFKEILKNVSSSISSEHPFRPLNGPKLRLVEEQRNVHRTVETIWDRLESNRIRLARSLDHLSIF